MKKAKTTKRTRAAAKPKEAPKVEVARVTAADAYEAAEGIARQHEKRTCCGHCPELAKEIADQIHGAGVQNAARVAAANSKT